MNFTYSEVREDISTGDVIGVEGRNLFSKFTKFAQSFNEHCDNPKITHAGMAYWIENRLFIVEMDGKHNVLRPLSQYILEGDVVHIYRPEIVTQVEDHFDLATTNPIKYDLIELIQIGYRLIFGGKGPKRLDGELVCSSYVANWLKLCGWKTPEWFPSQPSPAELCTAVQNKLFSIQYM